MRVIAVLSCCVSLLLVSTACGLSEAKFIQQVNELQCAHTEECLEDFFDEEWDDLDDCIDDYDDAAEDYRALYDDCEYDATKAKACLGEFKDLGCDSDEIEDMFDECQDVWDCDDDD